MTAEALVMNKSAVAMAADSTVTVSSGRQGVKTFDTVNKLFELIKGRPIGLMVYANGELNGMPWETVVKSFREENRGLNLPYLEDYFEAFTSFLRANRDMLDEESEARLVVDNGYSALLPVFAYLRARHESCVTQSGRIVMTRVRLLIEDGIAECEQALGEIEDAPWQNELDRSRILSRYGRVLRTLVEDMFEKYRPSAAMKKRLVALVVEYLSKAVFDGTSSGLVIAGFGSKDYFPKMHFAQVRGFLDGDIRCIAKEQVHIDREYPGHLDTFAQDEAARAYLTGITSAVREQIIEYWSAWEGESATQVESVLEQFQSLSAAERKQIAKAVHDVTHDRLHGFGDHMNSHMQNEILNPVWESIGFLPKEELAVMAETLVNLTLFRQRISIRDMQTVGGAIDVALMSKGDGFVWLRRKHYFTPELNPAWHLAHSGMLLPPEPSNHGKTRRSR